jgi:hypothetical protein
MGLSAKVFVAGVIQRHSAKRKRERQVRDASPRSGRQRKAWGGAQRNPRNRALKISEVGEAAVSRFILTVTLLVARAIDRFAGFAIFFANPILGFRYAPLQALCCWPLRGLGVSIHRRSELPSICGQGCLLSQPALFVSQRPSHFRAAEPQPHMWQATLLNPPKGSKTSTWKRID